VNEHVDPFDMLRVMAPPAPDRTVLPGEDFAADAMLERIISVRPVAAPPPGRFRWPVRTLVAAFSTTLVVGGGVAFAVWSRKPADPVSVVCYSEASREPSRRVGLHAQPELSPADQCRAEWADGEFAGLGDPEELVACVSDVGVTVVVPGDDAACGRLDFARAETYPTRSIDARVGEEVPALLSGCVTDPDLATAKVVALFDSLGASEWSVQADAPVTEDRPCYGNLIDAESRVVHLIPFAPPAG
jgi:hypothetical protein